MSDDELFEQMIHDATPFPGLTGAKSYRENTSAPPVIVRGDMQSLIDAFPSLRRRGCKWIGSDSTPFKRQMKGMSHGERCAAKFVLNVWNYMENKFDLGDAMNVWDDEHVAALRLWLANPWYK